MMVSNAADRLKTQVRQAINEGAALDTNTIVRLAAPSFDEIGNNDDNSR